MKKAFITAAVFIGIGIGLFIAGLAAGGSFRPIETQTKAYTVAEPFTDIHIDTHETDIVFARTADAASVYCNETEKLHCALNVEDGTLYIEMIDTRTWVDRLLFGHALQMTVYLPDAMYRALTIESRTGNVDIPDDFTFERISIDGSTGNVRCGASVSGALAVTLSTGNITLDSVRAKQLALIVSTGDIRVKDTNVQEDMLISVSTGKTELDSVTCASLTSNGSTGRIALKDCEIEHALWIKRSTGDVRFENVGAESITIETDTGDVTGTVRSDLYYDVETKTGKVQVPQSQGKGRCAIKTDTGDVRIESIGGTN